MARRRLTHRQQRVVQRIHARARARTAPDSADTDATPRTPERAGTVVVAHRRHVVIEAEGVLRHAWLRANLGAVACGDEVVWQEASGNEAVVLAIQPRRSVLGRPGINGHARPFAANIDRMVVVAAVEPAPVWSLVDACLAAAELLGIAPVVLINKCDLMTAATTASLGEALAVYRRIGYAVIEASVRAAHGLDALYAALAGHTAILIGQSGVGKSSLVKALLPDREVRTQAVSEATGLGRHTTTTATLYPLPCGGRLIDSPGVRRFGLWPMTRAELERGFPEIHAQSGHCRFNDCHHEGEPGCAVREAMARGEIDARRLGSFLQIAGSH